MSWEDENIDKLFQEASENISFEFKEEYWTEMEAMLPNKKRKFPFIWFFSGTIVCAVLTTVFFSVDNTTISKKSHQINSKINNRSNLVAVKSSDNKVGNEINSLKEQQKKNTNQFDVDQKSIVGKIVGKIVKRETKLNYSKNTNNLKNEPLESHSKTGNNLALNPLTNTDVMTSEENTNVSNEKIDALNNIPFPSNQFNQNLIPGPIFTSHFSRWFLYFDGSTTMGQSMIHTNSTGSNIAKGFGIATGINYSTKSWSFTSGISASFTSVDNLIVKERVKIYGFGVQNFDNEIEYRQLYTFETPLMAGFKQKNHMIQFGIVPSYLIGSKISYESKSNNEVITSSTLLGYRKGLTNFGLKPTIGYIYKITPSLQIGANLQVQLFSPIQDGLFEGDKNNFPINGQFFIRKSIFLK